MAGMVTPPLATGFTAPPSAAGSGMSSGPSTTPQPLAKRQQMDDGHALPGMPAELADPHERVLARGRGSLGPAFDVELGSAAVLDGADGPMVLSAASGLWVAAGPPPQQPLPVPPPVTQ